MKKIAVVAIAYNRLKSLHRLLDSLLAADYENAKVDLIISIDKSETTEVEKFADNFSWPNGRKIVRKHPTNLGLREHILSQGKAFDEYDALVILEDDIVVSPAFYKYASQTVEKYYDNGDVAGISLYSFPLNCYSLDPFEPYKNEFDVYMMNIAQSWGQVWMKKQWLEFYNWYLANQDFTHSSEIPSTLFRWKKSWLKYHTRYCIENNKYFVYPYYSFSTNYSDAGIHNSKTSNCFQTTLQTRLVRPLYLPDHISDSVQYDGFFQNKDIVKHLDISPEDVCIDLYQCRAENPGNRYLLTSAYKQFKIVKSYGLSCHPLEANIFKDIEGEGLFLYDTAIVSKNKFKGSANFYMYVFRIVYFIGLVRKYGISHLLNDCYHKIVK